jgi:hypothetical protein
MKRIISVSICLVLVLSASTSPLAQEKKEKPITFKEFEKEVKDHVLKRNKNLEHLFKKQQYEDMAKEFSLYAKITTHDRGVINASESAGYWESLGNMRATNLDFKLKSFYGWELTLSEERHPEETDFVIFEITKLSFTVGSNGEEDPISEVGSGHRHKVKCIRE